MIIPGLRVDFDEAGVDRQVKKYVYFTDSISAGWKNSTFVNIGFIYSVHRVGNFDGGYPLIIISSSLHNQSNVEPRTF